MSDHVDLAELLNFSVAGRQRRTQLWRWAGALYERASQVLSPHYDTLSFESHADTACCTGMLLHELVSLQNFSLTCPVSTRMRRGSGPRGSLRRCDCTDAVNVSRGKRRRALHWRAVC